MKLESENIMSLIDKLRESHFMQDSYLVREFGSNIHDIDLRESIKEGIVDKLLKARELDIKYAVVFGYVIPSGRSWDPYGDGEWNPKRTYITTEDIKDKDNDREKERQNIYDFLRGKKAEKKEINEMFEEKTESTKMEGGKLK